MIHPFQDHVHPAPFWSVLRTYRVGLLRVDLQAGFTVAIFAIPQVMAYALLAEVNPIHGLYAAMVVSIVAALWGSSPHVNSGPTNSASLLTAAALSVYMGNGNYMQIVFLFTLMVGIIRMMMGLVRMGSLVHFVPESAFLGFTVGVGSMIALGRLHHLLGIEKSTASWFPAQVADKLSRMGDLNPHALVISCISLSLIIGLQRYTRKLPVALIVIVLGILYALWIPGNEVLRVGDQSSVPSGLPSFAMPTFSFELLKNLWSPALAVALIGLMEAVSIGQALAIKHKQHLNFNQEFFGQGLGMIVSSFFQGIPGSGSFGRSALMEQSGAQTRFANVFCGIFTGLSLLFLPRLLNLIPMASLAALLLYIGIRLIDPKRIKRVWRTSRGDVIVMLSTAIVTVFVKIEYGIFTGIILGAMLFLNRSRNLRIFEVLPSPNGSFVERPYVPGSGHQRSAVVAVSVHGELFYGVAHELMEQLNEIANVQAPEVIVLRTRRAFSIDYSCWNAILDFAEAFQARGGKVFLTGIDAHTKQTIHDAHAHKWLPDEQLFTSSGTMMESFATAMKQAASEIDDPLTISGVWRDWLENPVVVTEEQVREIQKFLNGD